MLPRVSLSRSQTYQRTDPFLKVLVKPGVGGGPGRDRSWKVMYSDLPWGANPPMIGFPCSLFDSAGSFLSQSLSSNICSIFSITW